MSIFTDLAKSLNSESALEEAKKSGADPACSFEALRESYLAALRDKAIAMQNDGNFDLNEADVCFSTALNLNRVRNALVAIVGAGGLGNWQWRILAAMGFRRIAIYDNDEVGIENVGSQAHSVFDLGLPKVEAIENSALTYRGIKIIGRKRRVYSYSEICADLNEDPDIVIGCTDSADFRNGFIDLLCSSICSYSEEAHLPDLFIDYRMSLGDWVGYITPAKALRQYINKSEFCNWYKRTAVFSESEAVHEPCTERAIAYTGANVASFTGALLHWFFSGGRQKFYERDYMNKFVSGKTAIPGRKVSFSSRDFEFITATARERKLDAKIVRLMKEVDSPWHLIRQSYGIPSVFSYYDSGEDIPEDYGDRYRGKLIIGLKSHEAWLCGFDRVFALKNYIHSCLLNLHELHGYKKLINLVQPYAVFDSHTSRYNKAFIFLNHPVGSIFRIGCSEVYVRTQKDHLERMICRAGAEGSCYEVVKWNDFRDETDLPIRINDDQLELVFAKQAAASKEKEAGSGSGDAADIDPQNDPDLLKLERDELEVGLTVMINDEIVTIVGLEANHFKVQNQNGEATNYSWRRMPDVYALSDSVAREG